MGWRQKRIRPEKEEAGWYFGAGLTKGHVQEASGGATRMCRVAASLRVRGIKDAQTALGHMV